MNECNNECQVQAHKHIAYESTITAQPGTNKGTTTLNTQHIINQQNHSKTKWETSGNNHDAITVKRCGEDEFI